MGGFSNVDSRSPRTITIEGMLRAGESVSAIARAVGVSRARVQQINKRMLRGCKGVLDLAGWGVAGGDPSNVAPVKSLTLQLTPAVFAALVEACQVSNHKDPEEQITITDYVEQVLINNLVEMGLMRKHRKHTK